MFPTTDSSETIINCLLSAAKKSGVSIRTRCGIDFARKQSPDGFEIVTSQSETMSCDRFLLALGGCRTPSTGNLVTTLGHTLEPPVPSLFAFHLEEADFKDLAGISLEFVEATVPNTQLRERGPILITHRGFSGPVILRLSAWGARPLHESDYHFPLLINWLPLLTPEQVSTQLTQLRHQFPTKLVIKTPCLGLPNRLWEKLVLRALIKREVRWSDFSKMHQHQLVLQLTRTEVQVTSKSLNKEEFVTCGGVKLSEVNLKTMESRICPGLFIAGEFLDIDGITGGYNFQAAWTTGWIAGNSMAR
jgi:predicted Rossmann fold flavoprotein